ncbi:MAG: hypothetical protein WDW38_009093 [Sanguina aurantia]
MCRTHPSCGYATPTDTVPRLPPPLCAAGGAPCNVATALSRLGVAVTFVTALGDDERGTQLLNLCKERGVLMHAAQVLKGAPTRDVYVVRDNDGDREFAGFGRPTESYSDCFLDANSIPAEEISAATVLVTGTLGLAYPGSRDSLTRAADACRAAGSSCRLIVDVNWRPVFWGDADQARVTVLAYLEKASLIKISDSDLEWLLGVGLEEAMGDPCKILDRFPAAMGVMVTAGARGATYCVHAGPKSSVSGTVESFKVDTVDTTGAGDAFTAGFIYKLLEAGSLEQLAADPRAMRAAVVFAAAAGALTTTRPGAIESQPTLGEVRALVRERVPEREQ